MDVFQDNQLEIDNLHDYEVVNSLVLCDFSAY